MISIIVPVYNTSMYLKECVESILNQTYSKIEVVIVDDGSTDNSLAICKEYRDKDKRVRIFHKENSGVSSARNLGLRMAEGDYISFCDSDDVVKPELYWTLLQKLKDTGADRVCGGYEYLYPDNHRLYCKPRKDDGIYKCSDLIKVMIDDGTLSGFLFSGVNNSLFKSEIIKQNHIGFKENIKYNEDSLFSFEYALHSRTLYSMQSLPLYLYRQHNASSTKKRPKEKVYDSLHSALDVIVKNRNDIDYELQMKRRTVTETLWAILDNGNNGSITESTKIIDNIVKSKDLINCLRYIDYRTLNIYKKLFYFMIKYKMSLSLCIAARMVPSLSKYLSR